MEFALVLQTLWRLRGLVAVAALLSLVVGVLVAFHPGVPPKSRQYTVGVASARALVDTPSSQIVDLRLKEDANASVLPARAILLANLLASTPFRQETAKRAGVPADRLIALADTPTDSGPSVENPPATGASLSADDPRANVLTAHTDVSLPLITVNVQAPTGSGAARLADSALDVLDTQLKSLADSQGVPAARRLVVKRLGAAQAGVERRGPSPMIGVAAALASFFALSALIALVAGVRRVVARGPLDTIDDADELRPVPGEDESVLEPVDFFEVTRNGRPVVAEARDDIVA